MEGPLRVGARSRARGGPSPLSPDTRSKRLMIRQDSWVSTVTIAQDPEADELLGRDPLALVLGMRLDQHRRQRSSDARRWPGCRWPAVRPAHVCCGRARASAVSWVAAQLARTFRASSSGEAASALKAMSDRPGS